MIWGDTTFCFAGEKSHLKQLFDVNQREETRSCGLVVQKKPFFGVVCEECGFVESVQFLSGQRILSNTSQAIVHIPFPPVTYRIPGE